MSSVQELSPTREPGEEPLKSIPEVLGWQAPEKFPDETDEERAVAEAAAADKSPYDTWAADKSQNNLHAVVKSLQPTIGSVLSSIGGNDPNIRSKARVIAAKAVQTYKPESGASLPTWVSQNLRQLTRDIRKSNSDVRLPEGVQMDAYAIYRAETELADELGREPTVEEISDRAHMSIKRIADVRRKNKRQVAESSTVTEDGASLVTGSTSDFSQEAMDYVYKESDMNDRKLMEYLMGYGGHDMLDSKQIKQKLKLTDVQLTRRKMRLGMRINETMSNLQAL